LALLRLDPVPALTDFDRLVFQTLVSQEHSLRQVAARVDFERFHPRLAEAYSLDRGRPSIGPSRRLGMLFSRFHYKLSDRQLIERLTTDMAFGWFLDGPVHHAPPHHTGSTYCRQRRGAERFAQIFQELLTQAREAGLVKPQTARAGASAACPGGGR
jgi:transposase